MVAWLADGSAGTVAAAVAALVPDLAGEPVVPHPGVPGNPPRYWRAAARVGDGHIAKYAWSAEAAAKVDREIAVLTRLRELAPSLPVPEVVAASRDPVLLVTRFVPGIPGGAPYSDDATPTADPAEVGEVLATLHDPLLPARLAGRGAVELGGPEPQSTTAMLRDRFAGPVVEGARARRVRAWCDWIDDVQGRPVPVPTVVHGDLHAHNLVLGHDGHLRLVVDFEEAAVGDPAYDFRYLVAMRRDLGWFTACHEAYGRRSGRPAPLDRVLAWHIRTALGDALWRTERGLPLPGGLGPAGYVDDIDRRLTELAVGPPRP